MDCSFSTIHVYDCIHGRTDFMAHGGKKGALGTAGRVSLFLGGLQVFKKLATLADIDTAANDALLLAQRVAKGEDPVVDGHLPVANAQGPVEDQCSVTGHDPLIVGSVFPRFEGIAQHSFGSALADDVFTLR